MKLALFVGVNFAIQISFILIALSLIKKKALSNHSYALLFSGSNSLMILTMVSLAFIFSRAEVELFTVAIVSGIILLNLAIGYPIAFFLFKALKPMIDSQRQRD